ncbi:MAG: hypothetical protein BWY78_01516 [Alphaproteobacteria bacterium ADurb.Bin438]|nr:MAG: hypothetical protein BWY78_01516 [Alphaproteobacteria bacterium ADurb.Bin438]
MKKFLVLVLLVAIGGGAYLYTDKDMQKKALKEVDEITKKVDKITKKINQASNEMTGKKPEPIKLNRNVEINIKREAPKAETEAVISLLKDNDKVLENDLTQEDKGENTLTSEVKKSEVENQGYKPSPYVGSIKGVAKVSVSQPDRLLINGKIVRLYGINILNYKLAEEILVKIVENRLVNCGIINYSQNNIPYGVCFLVDEYNNSKLNINYYLVEQNLAQYVK